ncbi:helicase [Cellulomonas sp. APG4]|uniref:helicase-related protein n=1 Tax=Cellulomonas sp. APG4 TaxID=1538656 RepID=UPI001379A9B3|nr:helicase-related protein [Cellulomonas sp. APG4]NCT90976.1 helicase [Cellulomonas sp. APG4]
MTVDHRPDVAAVMSGLKDFQRATVEHVVRRLWTDEEPTKRFLVADEVGLGKTLVAKGVIAATVDHLWDKVERIDIVYICSNQQIAQQNLSRLNVVDGQKLDHADRLTMLPTVIKQLNSRRINIVSFTPGTSFHVADGGGKSAERVVLYWMLAHALGRDHVRPRRWVRFFQGSVRREETFRRSLAELDPRELDPEVLDAFTRAFDAARGPGGGALRDELESAVDQFNYLRGRPSWEVSSRRYRLIGALRSVVARASVEALEPDLVIMDEFQRFKDLMDPGSDAAELAHAIFDHRDAKVLLLSATPYKMYTLPDEPEGDDHYRDFVATVRFLGGKTMAAQVEADLRTMRTALVAGHATDEARAAKDRVEAALRRVMSRTERLAVSDDRDGMLREVPSPDGHVVADDLRALRGLDGVARALGRGDVFEYWRSAPYILNVMERDGYKVKTDLAGAQSDLAVTEALRSADGLLDWQEIERYEALDPGNAKMRGLVGNVLDAGAWRLAWLPPSLPYYEHAGAYADPALCRFTKRLVFSAWTVVPKAISIVLSYEAERRAFAPAGRGRRSYSGTPPTGLLQYRLANDRPAGMPAFAITYPSTTLARLGDPLELARAVGDRLPAPRDAVIAEARRRVDDALRVLPAGDPERTPGVDQRWYWAAPILLDRGAALESQGRFEDRVARWARREDTGVGQGFAAHARTLLEIRPEHLGPRPDDLGNVLADMALAGPGPCALRALSRISGGDDALDDATRRDQASEVAEGLRSLFNRPEIMSVLRADEDRGDSYWRVVLEHALDGGLQAVLDEYAHVLLESEGLQEAEPDRRGERLAERITEALTIQTSSQGIDEITPHDGGFDLTRRTVRSHFAARFGRARSEDKTVVRESHVRTAFNSPFWPFVLASTSVGQEGLDFHTYAHAVVHWNLPGNPVDLEQREGRVHRYKGHAVRKNIAQEHADAAFHATVDDPWFAMFLAATGARPDGLSDIVPCWVYAPEGGAAIERYVPAMPLSNETQRYRRLQRTVGAYRMVVGQPRQEDLLKYVGAGDADWDWMRMELGPPVG